MFTAGLRPQGVPVPEKSGEEVATYETRGSGHRHPPGSDHVVFPVRLPIRLVESDPGTRTGGYGGRGTEWRGHRERVGDLLLS